MKMDDMSSKEECKKEILRRKMWNRNESYMNTLL